MIKVNIHQLRKLVQKELKLPLHENEGDITVDVISDFLADRLRTSLLAHANDTGRSFLESPLADSAYFPSDQEGMRKTKNRVTQQVMTRLGPALREYVDAVVHTILKGGMQGTSHVSEAFGSANVAPQDGDIKRDAPEPEPQGMFVAKVDVVTVEELPDDYERCSCCGFDHEYEWTKAQSWHESHDTESSQEITGEEE